MKAAAPPSPQQPHRTWIDWLLFVAIVLLALVPRVIYVLQLRASPTFDAHVMDPLFHHEWAVAFARGEPFRDGPYFRAPLYTWFLGTIYWIFGTGSLAPRLVQAFISALNCGLILVVGRIAFSRAVGVIAGLAAVAYWLFVYYDAELLSPVLIVFLNLLLLIVLLRTQGRPRPLAWLLAGVLLGLSAIARPDVLLFAPLLAAWVLWLHWGRWRRALGYAALLTLGCLLPIAPVTVRNIVVGRDAVLIASYGGVNFYIGNNPDSDGMSAIVKGDPPEWWPCYEAQVARAERAEGRPLRPSEVSAWYSRQAWAWVASDPAAALAHCLRKLSYFWSRWEVSNNQDIYFATEHYTPVVHWLPVGFWLVGPLGFLGLLLSLRRARELLPLWGMLLCYLVSVTAFFVTARFRIPAAVALIVLAAAALVWLAQRVRARQFGPLAGGLVAVALMALIVARIPPGVDVGQVQGYRSAGMLMAQQQKPAEAEPLLMEALRREQQYRWPSNPAVYRELGALQLRAGKPEAAFETFTLAAQVEPPQAWAFGGAGVALAAMKHLPEAAAAFERALALEPNDAATQANLGGALVRTGRIDEGAMRLWRAIELDPNLVSVLTAAAQDRVRAGQTDAAIKLLRGGVARQGRNVAIIVPLVQLLAARQPPSRDDLDEAIRLGEHAVALTKSADPLPLLALAAAQHAAGRDDLAAAAARQALRVTPPERGDLARQINVILNEYERAPRR